MAGCLAGAWHQLHVRLGWEMARTAPHHSVLRERVFLPYLSGHNGAPEVQRHIPAMDTFVSSPLGQETGPELWVGLALLTPQPWLRTETQEPDCMEFKFSYVTLSKQLKPSVPVLIPIKSQNNGIRRSARWEENQFLEGSLVLPECTGERMSGWVCHVLKLCCPDIIILLGCYHDPPTRCLCHCSTRAFPTQDL